MSSSSQPAPPDPWRRPRPDTHPQWFGEPVDSVLASTHVSRDDLRRWAANGWISFDVDELCELEMPLVWEIEFVRSLARSGLSDAQIDELVVGLEKPYRFNPQFVAFHFDFGWVCPAKYDPVDLLDEHLDEWLDTLAEGEEFDRLQRIHYRVAELLKSKPDEPDE